MQVTTNFAYLPFGGGRRKCIGDQFALFESIVALAMLARRFTFEADPDKPEVGMTTGATIHTTDGLWMRLKPRKHDASANDSDDAASTSGNGSEAVAVNGVHANGTGAVGEEQVVPEREGAVVH